MTDQPFTKFAEVWPFAGKCRKPSILQPGHSSTRRTFARSLQSALGDLIGAVGCARPEKTFSSHRPGRQVREVAAAATDWNFYKPWQVLSDSEANELNDLLTRLTVALTRTA